MIETTLCSYLVDARRAMRQPAPFLLPVDSSNPLNSYNPCFETVVQALLQRLEDEASNVRSNAAEALGKLSKTNDSIQPLIIQWIEQHQDSEDVGSAIDALWSIVEG